MKSLYSTLQKLALLLTWLSVGGLLSACSDDNALPSPPAPPVVTTPPATPTPDEPEEPDALAAVSPVPEACLGNPLCTLAVDVANQFAQSPDNTCYIKELSFDGQMNAAADIALGESPQAYVSNSGFMQYLLADASADTLTAYQEVESTIIDGFSRPLAYQYHDFFNALMAGEQSSGAWSAMNDISELQAGDVLSWCVSPWCDGHVDIRNLDTGHTAVVVNASPIAKENIRSYRVGIPEDAEFFEVAIVDASNQVHGSILADDLTVANHRHQSGRLKDDSCTSNGGVGAGVILLAQWQEEDQRKWSAAWFNEGNHRFHNDNALGQFSLAFGRIQ